MIHFLFIFLSSVLIMHLFKRVFVISEVRMYLHRYHQNIPNIPYPISYAIHYERIIPAKLVYSDPADDVNVLWVTLFKFVIIIHCVF